MLGYIVQGKCCNTNHSAIILQAGILKIKWAIEVYVYLMLKLILFATNKQTGTIVNRVITKQAARSKTEHTENSDF